MIIKVSRQKAEWSKSGMKDKELLTVEFPNCISTYTNKSFKWLPSYEELEFLRKELDDVEKIWSEKK